MTLKKIVFTIAMLAFLPRVSGAVEFIASPDAPPHLNAVHNAYLAKDFVTMAREIKAALVAAPNDMTVQANVLGIYQQAVRARGQDGFPADWSLPADIKRMKIVSRRYEGPKYALKVQGNLIASASVMQLQVVHYSDQKVLIDKQAGIGGWMERFSTHTHDREYWSESHTASAPPATGLYLLKVVLKSGNTVDGWFIIDDDMNPTRSPEVTIPATDQEFQTGNPMFQWTDFRSPQYQPFEDRSLWVGIYNANATNQESIWTLFMTSPSLQQVTIGLDNVGHGVSELQNGKYTLGLGYAEVRRFGDVTIGRECTTDRMFSVQGIN